MIPNEPAQVGLQIPSFINNIGSNIFLPNITILRRYEFADNFTMIHGHHTLKFGAYELLRGNHTESHTFFPGRFVFGSLPGLSLVSSTSLPAPPSTHCNRQRWGCPRFTSRVSEIRRTRITRGR